MIRRPGRCDCGEFPSSYRLTPEETDDEPPAIRSFTIVDNPWLDQHIRAKGPVGAEYPRTQFLMEGDTPSFLNLINNGLSVPERPDWGGWGGRYEFYTPRAQAQPGA